MKDISSKLKSYKAIHTKKQSCISTQSSTNKSMIPIYLAAAKLSSNIAWPISSTAEQDQTSDFSSENTGNDTPNVGLSTFDYRKNIVKLKESSNCNGDGIKLTANELGESKVSSCSSSLQISHTNCSINSEKSNNDKLKVFQI